MNSPRPLWLPSASSAVRSLQCPGSVVLPRTKFETTAAMHRGSYLHLYLEDSLNGFVGKEHLESPRFAALSKAISPEDFAELRDTCSHINRDDILRGSALVSSEEAFAYHPATDSACSLGCSIEREYLRHGWKPTTEIAGTADVILRTPTGELIVGDFKTGHYDNQVSYSWAPQLDILGLMAARRYHVDSITVAICLVMDDGRIHWTEDRRLDALDLDAIAGTVHQAVASWHQASELLAIGKTPATKQGPWCDYCPSRPLCPAWLALTREFALEAVVAPGDIAPMLTPAVAGSAWEKLQRFTAIAEDLTKQLRDYAHHHPLVLSDGSRLGFIERSREELDGPKTE